MLTSTTGVSRGDSLRLRRWRASKPEIVYGFWQSNGRRLLGSMLGKRGEFLSATKVLCRGGTAHRRQDLQYHLGHAEAGVELAERAESDLRDERDRLIEDLKREGQRAERDKSFFRGLFGR
jgi:hypothetical protein